jgi:hypothetical protein
LGRASSAARVKVNLPFPEGIYTWSKNKKKLEQKYNKKRNDRDTNINFNIKVDEIEFSAMAVEICKGFQMNLCKSGCLR